MKIGVVEFKTWKAAGIVGLWLAFWIWPMCVRPIVFTMGRPINAVVRTTQRSLFGIRCRVIPATVLGPRPVRFQVYAGPQACKDLNHGSPVKLLLLKAGPLPMYWVQLENDYGYAGTQIFIAVVGFVLLSAAAGVLIYNFSRPKEQSKSLADLKDLLNKL